jgi:hypothetical protein
MFEWRLSAIAASLSALGAVLIVPSRLLGAETALA